MHIEHVRLAKAGHDAALASYKTPNTKLTGKKTHMTHEQGMAQLKKLAKKAKLKKSPIIKNIS
jgi:hypothetical protein